MSILSRGLLLAPVETAIRTGARFEKVGVKEVFKFLCFAESFLSLKLLPTTRSTRKGNVFTRVCDSVRGGGGGGITAQVGR